MRHAVGECILIAMTVLSMGCVTAAPGADQVKFTGNPADVSACIAVGNISAAAMHNFDWHVAQNLAVGLGANVVLRAQSGGVAYRCGNAARPRQ
jgi:hypothetical protein